MVNRQAHPTVRSKVTGFPCTGRLSALIVILIALQILVAYHKYNTLSTSPNYRTIRAELGIGLYIARVSAELISFSAAIILVPVSRKLLTIWRKSWLENVLPFDAADTLHKFLARCIVFFTVIHISAHKINFHTLFGNEEMMYSVTHATSVSGILAAVVLFLITSVSFKRVRKRGYNLFFTVHQLYVVFYVLLVIHGQFCFIPLDNHPFCVLGGTSWRWVLGGFAIHLAERLSRDVLLLGPGTTITKAVLHKSAVLELQFRLPRFRMFGPEAGQYVLINCPAISRTEWHPFTLTSSPQDEFMSVHIRLCGDWTKMLRQQFISHQTEEITGLTRPVFSGEEDFKLPRIHVFGPITTSAINVWAYKAIVLVGAGIGVTPYVSLIKSIWYRVVTRDPDLQVRKIYFVWVCRSVESFEWFVDLLMTIKAEDFEDFLTINLHVTMPTNEATVGDFQMPLKRGRPDFPTLLRQVESNHEGRRIGVFVCGPDALSDELRKLCASLTTNSRCAFHFNKERF